MNIENRPPNCSVCAHHEAMLMARDILDRDLKEVKVEYEARMRRDDIKHDEIMGALRDRPTSIAVRNTVGVVITLCLAVIGWFLYAYHGEINTIKANQIQVISELGVVKGLVKAHMEHSREI